jgi:hypothetical protein
MIHVEMRNKIIQVDMFEFVGAEDIINDFVKEYRWTGAIRDAVVQPNIPSRHVLSSLRTNRALCALSEYRM